MVNIIIKLEGQLIIKKNFNQFINFQLQMKILNADGYSSEKIIDSILSGTIPIYYGNFIV